MDTDEAMEKGYIPSPVKPLVTVGKTFSLALLLSFIKRKKKVIAMEELAPKIPDKV
jgi:hypothetical protein